MAKSERKKGKPKNMDNDMRQPTRRNKTISNDPPKLRRMVKSVLSRDILHFSNSRKIKASREAKKLTLVLSFSINNLLDYYASNFNTVSH